MSGSPYQVPADTSQLSDSFDLMVQAQINWETYLTPMCTSVAILADLVRQAKSGKDFPLNRVPEKSHLENPRSFQGCLLAICQQAPKSFQSIRDNMSKIRDLSARLMEREAICADKRKKLNLIQGYVKQCKDTAECVEQTLSSLNQQLIELLEICASSQTSSQAELQEVQRALTKTRESIESAEREERALEQQWSRVSLEREKIRGALNDIKSKAFTDTLCEEGLKQLQEHLPQLLDLLSSLTSPVGMVSELGKGVKFIIREISALRNKDSSSALSTFLADVEEKASQKIKVVQSQLEQAGERYEQRLREVERLSEQTAQMAGTLTAQETQDRETSSAIALMTKDLELLGNIRSNWCQVISFIHLIPRLMEDCQKMVLKSGDGKDGADTQMAELQDQMSQAVTIMRLLGNMSGTYVKIYDDYLKNPLKDLTAVMVQGGLDYKLKTIQRSCQEAKEEIHRLAKKDRDGFEVKVQQGSQALGELTGQLGGRE